MANTQDYLTAIQNAKANGTPLNNIDPTQWGPDVDPQTVVGSLLDGLPDAHANAINARLMSGLPVKQIDFGKIPIRQGTPEMQGSLYEDEPKTRFLMRNIVRPGAEILGQALGGTAGAAVGAATPIPGGAEVGGFGGATAGGTLADEAMNKVDQMTGLSHPEWQAPTSTGKRLGEEALGNAAMVGTGKVVGGIAKNVLAPLSESVNAPVQQAAQDLDIPLTASQQSNSKLLAQGEQTAAKLPGSSGIFGDFYAKTRARMMGIVNDLFQNKQMNPQIASQVGDSINQQLQQKVNDLGQAGITPQLDPADVGQSVAQNISDFTKNAKEYTNGLRSDMAQSIPEGTTVPLTNTTKQATKLLAQHQALPPALQDSKLVSVLNGLIPKTDSGDLSALTAGASPDSLALMQKAGITPQIATPSKSIPDILSLRSALGDAASQAEPAFSTNQPGTKFMGTGQVGGAYKSLVNSLDSDLQSYGTTDKTFGAKYAQVRGVEKSMFDRMDNPYIKSILSTDQPEKVIDMAVRKGDTSNLSTLQEMLDPDTREQLGNAFQNKLIENSSNADGQFLPQKLAQQIKQYGEPTIAQAVGPDGLDNLKKMSTLSDGSFSDPDFRNFVSQLGRKNGENVSGMLLGADPANINRVRSLIGEDAFGEAQDGMIHNLLTNNQDNVDFGGLAKRMSQIPPESLATALPPEKLATLQKLATVGGGIQASQREFTNTSGTAPMMGTFYILRSLFNSPMKAIQVLGGLAGGSEAYLSKPATDWLTNGVPGGNAIAEGLGQTSKVPVSILAQKAENPYGKRQK